MKKGILKKYRFINKIMNLYFFFLNVKLLHILPFAIPYKIRVKKVKKIFKKCGIPLYYIWDEKWS